MLRVRAGILGRVRGVLALLLLDLGARHAVRREEGDELLFGEGEAESTEGYPEFVVV